MPTAVISDIHGNLPALEAVLAAIDEQAPDELWCLGDLVGYGPWPNEVTASVRERADVCLVGNHDLVALGAGSVDVREFNPDAAAAALWTRERLTAETHAFLESLAPEAKRDGVELYHASPRDPVWEYVLTVEAAAAAFTTSSASVILVGHSHVALALTLDGHDLSGGVATAGTDVHLTRRHLLNPGSVGQPRDHDRRAAYLMLDRTGARATFERVEYDVERVQREIRAQGLPESLAQRLDSGV
jgi:diadenosine tetraphosphatase ApaH/serine/threonine PP2A family protein phosphatase